MYIYFWFLIVFLVVNSFLLLEEEILIVFAGILWLDAAGGLIRNVLWTELEERGDKIKDKFKWYLLAKKKLMEHLLSQHLVRKKIFKEVVCLYEFYVGSILKELIINNIGYNKVYSVYNLKLDLNLGGLALISNVISEELDLYVDLAPKSVFLKSKEDNLNSWVCLLN